MSTGQGRVTMNQVDRVCAMQFTHFVKDTPKQELPRRGKPAASWQGKITAPVGRHSESEA